MSFLFLLIMVLLTIPRRCFFVDPFCYFCFVSVMLSCLFITAFFEVTCWERANLLALLYVMFSCVFVTFSIWCPGSGVVLDCIFLDLRLLSYFVALVTQLIFFVGSLGVLSVIYLKFSANNFYIMLRLIT